MPGHMLSARCPCGFEQTVKPGSATPGQEYVIAYDPGSADLVTVDSLEAQANRLTVIRNPYLDHMRGSVYESGVQEEVWEAAFGCPKCSETSMRFVLVGFWCS